MLPLTFFLPPILGSYQSICIASVRALAVAVLVVSVPHRTMAGEPPVTHVVSNAWQSTDFRNPANPGCSIGGSGSVSGGRLMMGADKAHPDPVSLVIRKASWSIPVDTAVQIQVRFADGAAIQMSGVGRGQSIAIDLTGGTLRQWVHELTSASGMQIVFDGTEPTWMFDLAGTTTVVNAMSDCLRAHQITGVGAPFGAATGPSPQEASTAPTTQPFGTSQSAAPPQLPAYAPPVPAPYAPLPPALALPVARPQPREAVPDAEFWSHAPPPPMDMGVEQWRDVPIESATGQAAFLAAVEEARRQYRDGANDMAKGSARPARARALCKALPSRSASGWLGHISQLTTNGEGKGVIVIEVGPDIYLRTWNNSLSDIGNDTMIDPASPLFQITASMHVGQAVRFSASLVTNPTDCFSEASMTMGGSIATPEFIMHLTAIRSAD